jgi:hypothetical protein
MIRDMENLTARYRLSAEQCRRRADAAADEVGKATWLRFAEEWTKLANEAEQCLAAANHSPRAASLKNESWDSAQQGYGIREFGL